MFLYQKRHGPMVELITWFKKTPPFPTQRHSATWMHSFLKTSNSACHSASVPWNPDGPIPCWQNPHIFFTPKQDNDQQTTTISRNAGKTPVCSAKGFISAALRWPEPLWLSTWNADLISSLRPGRTSPPCGTSFNVGCRLHSTACLAVTARMGAVVRIDLLTSHK